MNDALRLELLAMKEIDQEVRLRTGRWPPGEPIPTDGPLWREWTEVDRRNTARLREIVAEYGWPTRSLVGEDGADAAWILAQHADQDPQFQAHCLELMTAAARIGEASEVWLAWLVDRVALARGEPQIYGTQFWHRDGRWEPRPVADPETVDERRRALGLSTLAELIEWQNTPEDAAEAS